MLLRHPVNSHRFILCCQPSQTEIVTSPKEWSALSSELVQTVPLPMDKGEDAGFMSGWAGYISYEASNNSCIPYALFSYYPMSIHIDMEHQQVSLKNPHALPVASINTYLERIQTAIASSEQQVLEKRCELHPKTRKWHSPWGWDEYQAAFNQVQAYLSAGDCYQINLAMPYHCEDNLTQCSPLPLFEAFKPSFGVYLKAPKFSITSLSPERFMRIEGNRMLTQPIKGTAPRGSTSVDDAENREFLLNSLKNQAENLMIVDLLRNDLSLSALPHSVNVTELFKLESHAAVHHLVSTIEAEKQPAVSALEAIYRAFPGGSITGAPKKRAMEIIKELEIAPRGPYCGSMGYLDDRGIADFNILIRTLVATPEGAECWGGGGITVESTAEDEYQEIQHKIGRILNTPI